MRNVTKMDDVGSAFVWEYCVSSFFHGLYLLRWAIQKIKALCLGVSKAEFIAHFERTDCDAHTKPNTKRYKFHVPKIGIYKNLTYGSAVGTHPRNVIRELA